MKQKELYAAPETEVLEMTFEQTILGGSTQDLGVEEEVWN